MIILDEVEVSYGNDIIVEKGRMEIPEGRITWIKGESGSGKTSLLYRIGLISEDRSHAMIVSDGNVNDMKESVKDAFRSNHLSYVL